jgi:hypothetical protein
VPIAIGIGIEATENHQSEKRLEAFAGAHAGRLTYRTRLRLVSLRFLNFLNPTIARGHLTSGHQEVNQSGTSPQDAHATHAHATRTFALAIIHVFPLEHPHPHYSDNPQSRNSYRPGPVAPLAPRFNTWPASKSCPRYDQPGVLDPFFLRSLRGQASTEDNSMLLAWTGDCQG